MDDTEDVHSSHSPQPSVLELYEMQQSNQQSGIRLSLNPELTESITLERFPYHFCAVTGNVNLAAFLYFRQFQYSEGITIANFAADGKEGTTPWSKAVTLSPVEIANMAGHGHAAVVLSLILAQVPLHWSRETHCLFPECFKQHAKSMMETLLTVPFFTRLPGSARVQMVDMLMTSLAQEAVWGPLSAHVWHEQWEECISDTFEQAQHLIKPQETSVQNVGSNPVITATFEIRTRPHRPHGFALDVCIVALGSLLAGLSVRYMASLRRDTLPLYMCIITHMDYCRIPEGLTAVEVSQHRSSLERILVGAACGCAGGVQPVTTTIFLGLRAFLRGNSSRT